MSWAFAKIGLLDVPLLKSIASEALRRPSGITNQELANLAWSDATIRFRDAPLIEAIS